MKHMVSEIDDYSALLARKDEIEAELKDIKEKIKDQEQQIICDMAEAGVDAMEVKGYRYKLSPKTFYNRRGGVPDDVFFDGLRDIGLGDIIRETVNANTLRAAIKDIVAHNNDQLPWELEDIISTFEDVEISKRKV